MGLQIQRKLGSKYKLYENVDKNIDLGLNIRDTKLGPALVVRCVCGPLQCGAGGCGPKLEARAGLYSTPVQLYLIFSQQI